MDQRLRVYTPHVLVVMKGQQVHFPNSDLVRHNVFSASKVHRFNLGIYPRGEQKEETFDQTGVIALLCNVHPEMSGYIVVVDTPWSVVVGADGTFRIDAIPPGNYELVAWHEGLAELRRPIELRGDLTVSLSLAK